MKISRIPWHVAAVAVTFVVTSIFEMKRPLRRSTERKSVRTARNLGVAALSAATLLITERPVTQRLTQLVERRRLGLLPRSRMRPGLETFAGLLLLDYTLYLWHALAHRVPFLWRFHQAHHADLEMDASTGLRFHAGELGLSVLWRCAQILSLGVKPQTLSLWNSLMLMEVIFHHSNIRLSPRIEQLLSLFIVTPRMHAIHHSIIPEEIGSNWSSGLTLWDWLHGTLKTDVPQREITIGLAPFRNAEQVTFAKTLTMPFETLKSPALLPDGTPAIQGAS
jgi:sterol desaturase/sphingolipid hydroxylase (fatty acid hydroxylase superfamily)